MPMISYQHLYSFFSASLYLCSSGLLLSGEVFNPVATLTVTDNSEEDDDGLDTENVSEDDSDTEVVTALCIAGIGIISDCLDRTSLHSLEKVCGLDSWGVSTMSFLLTDGGISSLEFGELVREMQRSPTESFAQDKLYLAMLKEGVIEDQLPPKTKNGCSSAAETVTCNKTMSNIL